MNKILTCLFVGCSLLLAAPALPADNFWEPYDDTVFDRPPGEPRHEVRRDGRHDGPRRDQQTYEIRRPRNPFLAYWQDRFLDFQDLFRFRVGFGGFGFHARVTSLAQVGFLYTNGYYFGMDRRAWGAWHEERFAAGVSVAFMTEITSTYRSGNEFANPNTDWNRLYPHRGYARNGEYFDDGRWRFLSIAAELHLGIIGVDVAFYPDELFDFFLGFGMIDIFGDDLRSVYGRVDEAY